MDEAVSAVADEKNVQAAERLMDAANRLEVGGIIFIVIIAILALIAFFLWLKSKSDAAKVANRRLEIEQEGKRERAKMYASTVEAQTRAIADLSAQIVGMREDATTHNRTLGSILNENSIKLAAQIQRSDEETTRRETARDKRLTDVFGALRGVLDELLDRQKGVINFDDSIRIIEECFDRSVKPAAVAIAEQSLAANHWRGERIYIEERVRQELNAALFNAERGLSNYQLSVDHKLFFPGQVDGPFDLAMTIWNIIKELHEEGTVGSVSLEQRLRSARIRIENAVNMLFNEAKQSATRIHAPRGEAAALRIITPNPDGPKA